MFYKDCRLICLQLTVKGWYTNNSECKCKCQRMHVNYLTAFPCIAFVNQQVFSLIKQVTFHDATTEV